MVMVKVGKGILWFGPPLGQAPGGLPQGWSWFRTWQAVRTLGPLRPLCSLAATSP